MSLQFGAQQSRVNGTGNAFGTMCKFNISDSRSLEERNQDVITHRKMVEASNKGDWDLYLSLQSTLN